MKTSDFDFDLSNDFIAQTPSVPRDSSKLLVFDTAQNKIYHLRFKDIKSYLNENDVLVLNKIKVFPARINFSFNNKLLEIFLLKNVANNKFLVLVKPGKLFKLGMTHKICEELSFTVDEILADGSRIISFIHKSSNLLELLSKIGKIPFPPYIKNAEKFSNNYQTVFSDENYSSSVAAPTAGLHFTKDLITDLKKNGVSFVETVLNVGRGTFLPVKTEKLEDHIMHYEDFYLSKESSEILNASLNKRIIAVGTTSVRVLESSYNNGFSETRSSTNLFIYPKNYQWKIVSGLITNFHLPKSTLIMLVASFLEHKNVADPVSKILELYEVAKKEGYRFYSFGDSMFIF